MCEMVTITAAVYNSERYLDKFIISVLQQDYSNWELILVNDGSNDNSESVCLKYIYDSRIKVINKSNGGLSSARQVGLDKSSGKYICFVDPDDYLQPNYISSMFNQIKRTDADICVCSTNFIEKEQVVYTTSVPTSTKELVNVSPEILADSYYKLCLLYYMGDSWNKMYCTDFIRESGVCFELAPKLNGSDLAFNHKLLLHSPTLTYINSLVYNHVIVENSAVHRKNRKLITSYNIIMKQLLDEVERLSCKESIYKQLYQVNILFMRDGIVDAFRDNSTWKERYLLIKELVAYKKQMIKKYPLMVSSKYDFDSKTLSAFERTTNNSYLCFLFMQFYSAIKRKKNAA